MRKRDFAKIQKQSVVEVDSSNYSVVGINAPTRRFFTWALAIVSGLSICKMTLDYRKARLENKQK